MSTALLIIDVQHALCTGKYECFDIQRIIETINGLSARVREAGVPVILVQHEEKVDLLQHGSEGWQLAQGLHTSPQDLYVRKTTRDSFYRTNLGALLQEHNIDRLIMCGLQTDYCVNATSRQAHERGFDVVLVSDAHSTVDNDSMTAADIIAEHNEDLARLTGPVARVDVIPASQVKL